MKELSPEFQTINHIVLWMVVGYLVGKALLP
jgi:hypothetical protein